MKEVPSTVHLLVSWKMFFFLKCCLGCFIKLENIPSSVLY